MQKILRSSKIIPRNQIVTSWPLISDEERKVCIITKLRDLGLSANGDDNGIIRI